MTIRLMAPGRDLLAGYAAALAAGWSPDNTRDVSGEQLAALRADAGAFLDRLTAQGGTITLWDGREVPKLPHVRRWISDGEFCGSIGLRWQEGSDDLPPHVLGHIGYAVVPGKRRRGYARAALGLMLGVAREVGLGRVMLTCAESNVASRRVIEANGGVLTRRTAHPAFPDEMELEFWIGLGDRGA